MPLNLSLRGETGSSHISGHQLLTVVQVLHGGHALGAEVVVVRVGRHQQHVYDQEEATQSHQNSTGGEHPQQPQ